MDKIQIVSTYKKVNTTYYHPGITQKPSSCQFCKLDPSTNGFCADWLGTKAKLALMFPSALKEDILNGTPDKWSFFRNYLHPKGIKKEDVLISHVIRCSLKWNKKRREPTWPIGTIRKNAENSCRFYDNKHGENGGLVSGGIEQFSPNLFLITFDPADLRKVPAYHRQLVKDIEKVLKFVNEGYRVCVLLGSEPSALIAPFTIGTGGCKTWRGHFWDVERWPFEGGKKYEEKSSFKEANLRIFK